MRQVIATALFKARREARLSPSDAERALPVSSGSARPLAAEVGAGCAPPSPLRFHPTSDLHARGGRDEATGGWRGGEQEELGLPLPAARRRVILQNGEVVGVQAKLAEVARIVTDAAAAAAREEGRAAAEGAVALSCFSLRDTQALHGALRRAECVLHLAGPYEETASAVASGAVLARTHYVDVSGEWRSVQAVQALGDRAAASGVMLLPAAGFDSVPTDALAARLKLRWAASTAVVVGVLPVRGALSRGTARVLLRARRAGETPLALVGGEVQPCSGVGPSLDFGAPHGALPTAVTALPDLITASLLPSRAGEPRVSSLLITQAGWFASARPHEVEPLLERFAAASATGPDERVRMAAAAVCSGEARDAAGGLLGRGLLRVPDPYDTTVLCVVEIASRVLSGSAPPGFQSPSSAFGDMLLDAALGDRCQWTFSDR
ncbi:hypothetical protein EMIHUDRAFT_201268 [Emiliania huxleyi CCMP1516]|uniref:Saccharopine dehydrogenase NADP binding domain-containing protein n=2 Tax=Emiliania huxleyi TaxID=2903 RepID=A0A0D3KMF2_EMIH1|nr:hypothetical protein EMIHUDRAFT_201268 [Emiliania huxleyi CCMP1516]EOD36937.1 hypothetical protein EMIHUDRAFT_201268 [Emiliania huxleyi CCMP1516]|eukprot:XP_005789366.1 hypothetical protein EMIHUDRAFT_201268 [Emiliania huxleyi CCMP1516]